MDIASNYLTYFFLVGLAFISFIFIISVFGYFFLFMIKKYFIEKEPPASLSYYEQFFISFGIGTSVYISLSYFLDLLALFNFITAYLSLIIFDLIFVIYYYRENGADLKKKINFKELRQYFVRFISNRDNIFYLALLIFTVIIIFTIQWIIITHSTSLNYTDSYKWYADTFFLLDYGHINYYHLDYNYPSGYTYFNAGVLLVYPDYIFGYYYFKLVPLYFIIFYIVIAFTIIKKLFVQRYLIALSFLLILTSRYFLSRTLLYVSSSLASALLIISLIIIINKYPDYILGFLIAGLYFIHNLTAFFFSFVLCIFYLYKYILIRQNRDILFKQIKSLFVLVAIFFVLLIPYIVSIYYIYNHTIFDFIFHFFERFEEADYAYSQADFIFHLDLINLTYPLEYFEPFVQVELIDLFDELFERSIYLFFIFPLIGIFIYLNPKKYNKCEETIVFFKIFIITIIFFFFLPYFFVGLNLFIKLRKRILQSFSLPIIIMTLYSFEYFVNFSSKLTKFLANKFDFYKKLISKNKTYSKLFKIESVITILLLTSVSASFMQHRYPDYSYSYDDELVEVVFYLRNHAESDSNILREDFDSAVIFRILYDMDIKKYEVNESSTYENLKLEIFERDIDYLIYSRDYFENKTIDDRLEDHSRVKELLKNDDFILYRIKQ